MSKHEPLPTGHQSAGTNRCRRAAGTSPPRPAAPTPAPASAIAPPALLPARRVHERRDVAPDQILSLRVPDSPRQALVRLLHGARRMRRGHSPKCTPHVLSRQVVERDPADRPEQLFQRICINLDRFNDRPGRPSASHSSAVCRTLPVHRTDSGVEFGVQLPKLVLDLGLGLATDLLADPPAVSAEAERDNTAPPACTAPVLRRVAALSGVIEVESVVAIPAGARLADATRRSQTGH